MPCVALSVQSSFSICLKDHRCKQLFPRIVPTHESRRGASGNFFGMCLRSWYGLTMSACSYHKVASWLLSWTLSRSRTYLIKALQLADERYHHRSSFMPLYATLLLLLLLLLANHVLLNHAHCSCIHSTGRSQLRVRAQDTTKAGAKRQDKSQRERDECSAEAKAREGQSEIGAASVHIWTTCRQYLVPRGLGACMTRPKKVTVHRPSHLAAGLIPSPRKWLDAFCVMATRIVETRWTMQREGIPFPERKRNL